MNLKTILALIWAVTLTNFMVSAGAQEVSIPDPGLNAAVRESLQKPSGPLTEQDMLNLTTLRAENRGITNAQGLDAARNLLDLNLDANALRNFVLPTTLTNLIALNLANNQVNNFALP